MLVNCIVAKAAYIGQYLLYVSGGQMGSYLVGELTSPKVANFAHVGPE